MILGGIVLMLQSSAMTAKSVAFRWTTNREPDIAGYRIHYGTASRTYTQVVDVGNVTRASITNLVVGRTYYFALTAYNTRRLESEYSNELSYLVPNTVPLTPARLQIRVTPTRQTIITAIGATNSSHAIEASPDLKAWTNIGSVNIGSSGFSNFTDTNAPTQARRFYRARAFQPVLP